ncbi:PIN domain nuclease [uncultured Psychrobacter sp.]|uniref:type II toxin-antitoxin system VapC family toxin n=1 Tax=uncultured Psychrobacter sp. TaxID=259303 RepID=UPI003458B5B4
MKLNIIPTIIVDSSVWIDYFNGIVTPHTDRLDTLLSQAKIGITDVILMEVLQGFKEDKHYSQAFSALNTLFCYDILGKDNAIRYVSYYRQLRKKGITIRKSNDVMIAGFCIDSQIPLLFSDKDFDPFVEHLGLISALDLKAH